VFGSGRLSRGCSIFAAVESAKMRNIIVRAS
jgi:hypothetical protein